MKKDVLIYVKFVFINCAAQLIAGSSMTFKMLCYSLLGAGVWLLIFRVASHFTKKEK